MFDLLLLAAVLLLTLLPQLSFFAERSPPPSLLPLSPSPILPPLASDLDMLLCACVFMLAAVLVVLFATL